MAQYPILSTQNCVLLLLLHPFIETKTFRSRILCRTLRLICTMSGRRETFNFHTFKCDAMQQYERLFIRTWNRENIQYIYESDTI